MKRYILPIVLIVVGSLIYFYGRYQTSLYDNQPWTRFTGVCLTYETPTGCPEEAAETNARLSSTPEAQANQLWHIGVTAGFFVTLIGLVLGLYRFIRARLHNKATSAKAK